MKFQTFSKKQMQALSWWCRGSPYEKYDALICDGAIRSGKTVCMSISFIAWSFYRFNNSSFALCGKTIRSIRRNVVSAIVPTLLEMGFKCNEKVSQNLIEITYHGRLNKFYLFGGKDESSASLIQGMTLSGVLFDEVALMPKSFVEQAIARCSVEGSKFWFNCNPEYPGHWFFREWILEREKKNAIYLHFRMEDNPSIKPHMLKRYRDLYSGTFYDRFIEGKWVAAEGAVYPMMSNHENFIDVPKVAFEKYSISCDYGTVNPSSFGLWGRYRGVWYRIKEYYYNSRKIGIQRTDEEHYQALCELADGVNVSTVVVDPSAASFITLIKKYDRFKVLPAKNNVVDGIRQVSSALKNGEIKICNTCTDSIREFGLYRWENSASKDVPIKENDHAMDDIRYFVTTILLSQNDGFFAMATRR